MFWDVLALELGLFLSVLVGGAVVCLLFPFIMALLCGKVLKCFDIKYYCDVWKFYAVCFAVWLGVGVIAAAVIYWDTTRDVVVKKELTVDQKKDALRLCQHEFDGEMKKAKTKVEKDKIEQKYKNNWFKITDAAGKKILSWTDNTRIPQWQKRWVQLRAKLENKLNRVINAGWEINRQSGNKQVLTNKSLKDDAIMFLFCISKWQIAIVSGFEWLATLVLLLILWIKTRKEGTPEKVKEQLLGAQ